MSAAVELAGIRRTFPGVVALDDVSLTLRRGTVHALVGENGAGKTTLIYILGGSLRPERGEVRLDEEPVHFADAHAARALGILTVHQEVDLFGDLTLAENVGLEQGLPAVFPGWLDRRELRRRAGEALAVMHASLDRDALAETLTPAQRQMLLLGAALSRPLRVLVLDEPTSSLSRAESEVLFEQVHRLRAAGVAILYVSHRFEEIFALADEITVLRDGRRVWHGPRDEITPPQLIEKMVGRETPNAVARADAPPGPVVLRCERATAADGSFQEVSLDVRAGEVVGLYGLVGAGRSEWAQGLLGLRPLAHGTLTIDGKAVLPAGPGPIAEHGIAYVPEDRLRQGLCRGLSVRANYVMAILRRLGGIWRTRAPEAQRTAAGVADLAIRLRSIEQAVGTLSGGNQQKVVLGRWLERRPRVLLLDEPTRGIDVAAKGEIHALVRRLADAGMAVVLISSDLPEVLTQSDRIGVFREGRLSALLDPRTATAETVAAAALPVEERQEQALAAVHPPRRGFTLRLPWREAALALLLLLLYGAEQFVSGQFFTASSVETLATEAALLSFCALGAAIVLLGGGIDISIGSQMALSAGIAGSLWEREWPLGVVLPCGIVVGAACGFVNAALTLLGRVHPIVVTLGTLSLYRGLLKWWMTQDVNLPLPLRESLIGSQAGLPVVVWVGIAAAVLVFVFLQRTISGRHLYAVGSNPAAAQRAGISRSRAWLIAFTVQGALAGFAGLAYLAQSGNLQPVSYSDKTLEAIAAAVVGGVALTGGRGSVGGVLLGCLFLVSLAPACQHLDIPRDWQRVLVGTVMVAAVALDAIWRRKRS
jgi:ABC-type sugar transport system ATPase subunit/ribose/xylose/arabinose/galactoside ABC-type transport system permease subunit